MKKVVFYCTIAIAALLAGAFFLWHATNQSPSTSNKNLSDEELLQYARSPFDKETMMFKDFVIGYHNSIPVRVSFPCSDVCPEYTMRIIRYDVNASACKSLGGEARSIYVPQGIGVIAKEFCFPKVLVDNNIYAFVEGKA